MADLLASLTPQQPQLLDSLFEADQTTTSPVFSPEYTDKVARMAALTEVDPTEAGASETISKLTEQYKASIELSGDNAVRTAAAAKQRKARIDSLIDLYSNPDPALDLDGTIGAAARNLALRAVTETEEQHKKDALERQAIAKIQDMAQTDPTQAAVRLNNLENGWPLDMVLENMTKRLILEREIQKAAVAKEDQPWMLDFADFMMQMLPLNYSMGKVGNVDLPGLTKGWLDNLQPGNRINAERSSLWNLPSHEFADVFEKQVLPSLKENSTLFGFHDRAEYLNLLTQMRQTDSPFEHNAVALFDNLGGIGVGTATKYSLGVGRMLIANGARKQAGDLATHALVVGAQDGVEAMAAKTGLQADEVASLTLPGAVNPSPVVSVPLTGETTAVMDRTNQLIQNLPEFLPTERFVSLDEMSGAIEAAKKRLSTEFSRPLANVVVENETLTTGSRVTTLDITLGTKDGYAFATKGAANRYMAGLGEAGEVIQDESGGWFVKIKKNMPETGFYVEGLDPNKGKFFGLKLDNPILNTIINSRLLQDSFVADLAQASGNKVSRMLKEVVKPLADDLNKLGKSEKRDLAQVMMKGERESTWYTVDELQVLYQRAYKRNPTDRELAAYQAVRDANDLEWRFRNDDLYMNKVIKGFETASIDLGDVGRSIERRNALVDRHLTDLPKLRVYNVAEGIHYTRGQLTKETLDRLKAEGYVLVQFDEATTLLDGTKIRAFLVKAKDAKFEPLRRDQLPYRAGGHRFYKDKYYSKQAVKGRQPDTLEEYLDSPNTYIAGSKAEIDWWNGKMEAARKLYNDIVDDGRIPQAQHFEDILNERGLPTPDEFLDKIDEGVFQKDTPFVTLYDRELPDEYVKANPDALAFNQDETGFNGWLRTNGRMYYSGKGEILKDWRGDAAEVLDPFEAINKSLKNVANLSSFTDYKISSVERWVDTFKDYLADYNPQASALHNFSNAQFNKNSQFARIAESAEKQRQIIRRTLGWQTDADMKKEQMHRSMIEWINGSNPEGVRNMLAKNYTNWWDNNNPVAAMRALAFDMKLGLWNPVQLMLQVSTSVASIALSPKFGGQAFMNGSNAFLYMTKSGTEHMLNTFVERGAHKMAGFADPKEYKAFMRSMKKSGFLDIGGTHGLVQNWGVDAAMSDTGNMVQRARDWGRVLFNRGEMINRSIAMHIAWKETRERFPKLAIDKAEFLRRWQGRSEDYAFSMSSQSSAWWQNGIMSIPTQFWSYQMRMLEAMLGNQFTPSQRIRLALTQFFMYGTAGLPVLPLISEKLKGASGEAPELGTFLGLVDRGLLDNIIAASTGVDVAVGRRLGTGPWLTDTIKDFFGLSQYGEKSFAELVGGATGSTMFDLAGSVGSALKDVLRHSAAESGGDIGSPISRQAVIKLFSNISTISNVHKAMMVSNYNVYVSNKGQVLASDVPSGTAAFMLLFGAQPGQMDQLSAMREWQSNKTERIVEATRVIEMYRQKMLTEPDRAEEYAEEINLYVRLLPADIRQRALARANRTIDKSLLDSYARRVEKAKAQEQLITEGQE